MFEQEKEYSMTIKREGKTLEIRSKLRKLPKPSQQKIALSAFLSSMTFRLRRSASLMVAIFVVSAATYSQSASSSNYEESPLKVILSRVADKVQKYHEALFSIQFDESVRQQETDAGGKVKNKGKEFVYESIVVSPSPYPDERRADPFITRTLKIVDGKPTEQRMLKEGNECVKTNPRSVYADPLSFLLSARQKELLFAYDGETSLDGRRAMVVSFEQPPFPEPVKLVQSGNCFYLSRSPRHKGMAWIDAESYDVLQVRWELAETFTGKTPAGMSKMGFLPIFRPSKDLAYEKDERVVRFRLVKFSEPEQSLLLPYSAETAWTMRGGGVAGYKTSTLYTGYRRFRTDVKITDDN
ncbi:MAG: hypothetical protein ACRD6X_08275 [Pyrinomonadaceae bacterium]